MEVDEDAGGWALVSAANPDAPDPMASLKRGLGNGKRKRPS